MSRNLLVYEADVAMSEALNKLSSSYNFNVFEASSEGRVQEALGKEKMDLFIIRAENPGMKGFMLCKKIRAMEEYANVPILLISSDAKEEVFERHRQFEYRADFYLKIPVDNETMLATTHAIFPFLEGIADIPVDSGGNGKQVAELKNRIAQLEKMLEEADKSSAGNELGEEVEALVQANQELTSKNEELQGVLAKLEEESGELKDAIAQKGFQIKGLEEKISDLQNAAQESSESEKELKKLSKELENTEKEKEEFVSQIEKLEGTVSLLSEELEDIKKENDELQDSVKTLKEAAEAKKEGESQEIADFKKKLAEQKDQNDVLSVYNKEMKDRVKKIEKETADALKEKENAVNEMEKLKADLEQKITANEKR
jgi:DNA-binding response OmpR family regulator/uncharacterized protein YigA (DUF484 family)